MICGKNQFFTTENINPCRYFFRICRTEVRCFTTVHMHHMRVVDVLKKLRAQLRCKQDARSNNHDGLMLILLKLADRIKDHYKSLASTCGHDKLTKYITLHSSQGATLVRPKFNHWFVDHEKIIQQEIDPRRSRCDTFKTV